MANNNEKRKFDSTVSFTFFGSWFESLEDMETEDDKKSHAYMLFKAIAEYSMYGIDPDFDNTPHCKPAWRLIKREIDLSIRKRKGYFDGDEYLERCRKVVETAIKYPDISIREISRQTGISNTVVQRIMKKHNYEIEQGRKGSEITSGNASDCVSDDANESDCDADIDSVTVADYYDDHVNANYSVNADDNDYANDSTGRVSGSQFLTDDELPF